MMKSATIAATIGAFAMLLCVAGAHAQGQVYVGADAGVAFWSSDNKYYEDETNRMLGVRGGYRWATTGRGSFGVDVGYLNFGSVDITVADVDGSVDASAFTVGGNYRFRFGPATFFNARVGLMNLMLDNELFDSDSDTGLYAGIGVGHWLTPHIALGLSYSYQHANTDYTSDLNLSILSVGAVYRF